MASTRFRPNPYAQQPSPLVEGADEDEDWPSDGHVRRHDIVLLEDADLYRYHQREDRQPDMRHPELPLPHQPVQQQRHFHQYNPHHQQQQQQADYHYDARGSGGMLQNPRQTNITAASSYPESTFSSLPPPYLPHGTPLGDGHKHSGSAVEAVPLNHGAFRPGGAVNLFSRDYIGLPLNWLLVGFFNGGLAALITPIFVLFNLDELRANSADALITSPWYFKFLFGFLSDCVPINRYRRKPYIYIGWFLFTVFLALMAIMEDVARDKVNDDGEPTVSTPESTRYIVPLMFGSIGRLMVTMGIEGMMIEFAHREGEFIRGRTQCWLFIFRFLGEAVGMIVVALAFNGPEFEGSFAASVSLRVMFAIFAGISFLGLLVTRFWLKEEQVPTSGQRLSSHFRRIWSIIQRPTTWQLMCFGFFVKAAYKYVVYENKKIYFVWLDTAPLAFNLVNAADRIGSIIGAFLLSRYWLNTNWRKIIFWTCLASLVISVPADMVTVWDTYRNDVFYLSKKQLAGIFESSLWLLRLVIIIEITDPGYEATTYGIISTVYNLATPVVSTVRNVIGSTYSADQKTLVDDTYAIRMHVMTEFLCIYGVRIVVTLLALPLIPRQKRHAKERKVRGNPSMVVPIVLFSLFVALFIAAFTANVLTLFESTSCLTFAGGSGCNS